MLPNAMSTLTRRQVGEESPTQRLAGLLPGDNIKMSERESNASRAAAGHASPERGYSLKLPRSA